MMRVKPLEWAEHKESGNWTAETPFGEFRVYRGHGDMWRFCVGRGDGYLPKPTLEEAKAAAQAHADQLVADMAQPVTPQDAARVLLGVEEILVVKSALLKVRHDNLEHNCTVPKEHTALLQKLDSALATPPTAQTGEE